MRQICFYCGLLFGIKEPLDLDEETHGICPWCLPDILKNIEIELAQIDGVPNHLSQSPETYNPCFGSPTGIGNGVGGND